MNCYRDLKMKTTVNVSAKIKSRANNSIIIEVSIPLLQSMAGGEEVIQAATRAVGELATGQLLKNFDTDGSAITVGTFKFTSKGKVEKEYETPYGKLNLERHVYQGSDGGTTFCPLDDSARIIRSATPKLAKMIANKYSRSSVDEVHDDFSSNHGRDLSRSHIQNIVQHVGEIAIRKENLWSYSPPIEDKDKVTTIAIGMDGAMMLMREDGYREAMSGTIAFYDSSGKRLHTDYIAAAPEYGKTKFLEQMSQEICRIKKNYPDANYVGIADGASDNWKFLEKNTSEQITDFYHATEYLTSVSQAVFQANQEKQRIEWLEQHCHELKHNQGAANKHLEEFKQLLNEKRMSAANREKVQAAITYFTNQGHRMNYFDYREKKLPIGSGVTEAACKTIIKQRLCRSGMRWKNKGASVVIALKCLIQSKRWEQFWEKIHQYGASVA